MLKISKACNIHFFLYTYIFYIECLYNIVVHVYKKSLYISRLECLEQSLVNLELDGVVCDILETTLFIDSNKQQEEGLFHIYFCQQLVFVLILKLI